MQNLVFDHLFTTFIFFFFKQKYIIPFILVGVSQPCSYHSPGLPSLPSSPKNKQDTTSIHYNMLSLLPCPHSILSAQYASGICCWMPFWLQEQQLFLNLESKHSKML